MPLTDHQEIGLIGEDYAAKYIEEKGFKILRRNYLKKWGEIDIVAEKRGVINFIEVKTRSFNFFVNGKDWYRPENNLHSNKLSRIKRAIQSYLYESGLSIEDDWEFSAITVIVKRSSRELYKIEHLENLII